MDKNVLPGLAGVITIFVVGAVFGRVAGTDSKAIGDRVMSGLIAVPLIALAVRAIIPNAASAWAIVAPVPLVIYVILLFGTDKKFPHAGLQKLIEDKFVYLLLVSVGTFYTIVAAIILGSR